MVGAVVLIGLFMWLLAVLADKYVFPWLDAPVDPESLLGRNARVGAGAKEAHATMRAFREKLQDRHI